MDVECEVGDIATVWDGEVAGMAEGLAKACRGKNIFILADSQAAISAVKRAGKIGKARSHHLRKVVNETAGRKRKGTEVSLGWVKAHIGILGHEVADVSAKRAAEKCGTLGEPRTVDI